MVDLDSRRALLTACEGDSSAGVGILKDACPDSGVRAYARTPATSLLTGLDAVGTREVGVRQVPSQDLIASVATVTVNVGPRFTEPAGAGTSLGPGSCGRSVVGQLCERLKRGARRQDEVSSAVPGRPMESSELSGCGLLGGLRRGVIGVNGKSCCHPERTEHAKHCEARQEPAGSVHGTTVASPDDTNPRTRRTAARRQVERNQTQSVIRALAGSSRYQVVCSPRQHEAGALSTSGVPSPRRTASALVPPPATTMTRPACCKASKVSE